MSRKIKLEELTKYEFARVIGSRALQLAMGAPPLVKVPEGMLHPVRLARLEFDKGVVPLQVIRETG